MVEEPGKTMKIPNLSIQQLLEAGVHLGHKTLRWNPKMKKYIFGKRDSVHIIDLTQTLELTNKALEKIYETISNNGKILFISTKKQASEAIAELAKSTDQYFVNYRWLGGMLTNWGTISNSIKKLQKINSDLKSENRGFTKKELLKMSIQRDKLQRSLGGISDMKKVPDLVFIIDTNYESLAIKESLKLIEQNKTEFIKQDEKLASYAKKIEKSEAEINWNNKAKKIIAKINALYPFPGSWFKHNGNRVKITKAQQIDLQGKPGEILNKKFTIACQENAIEVLELQKEGKKKMNTSEYLKGIKLEIGSNIGKNL